MNDDTQARIEDGAGMMRDWEPQAFPFADPSAPDLTIETPLWRGGPKPQAEVAGETAQVPQSPYAGLSGAMWGDAPVFDAFDYAYHVVQDRLTAPAGLYVGDLNGVGGNDNDFIFNAFSRDPIYQEALKRSKRKTWRQRIREWLAQRVEWLADRLDDFSKWIRG